jgi:hypothetical protein
MATTDKLFAGPIPETAILDCFAALAMTSGHRLRPLLNPDQRA